MVEDLALRAALLQAGGPMAKALTVEESVTLTCPTDRSWLHAIALPSLRREGFLELLRQEARRRHDASHYRRQGAGVTASTWWQVHSARWRRLCLRFW